MPYDWKRNSGAVRELHLWPHNSLPPRGVMVVVLGVFALGSIPLLAVLGSVVLWGLLPFLLVAVLGLWLALEMNYRHRRTIEVLTLTDDQAQLVRHEPGGRIQEWHCNRYWAQAEMHEKGGPVPHYVTLKGGGREVEIGSFLSEDERIALFDELTRAFKS
ncbi:hypothetical protein AVO45_01445 [Ruegeria marisrubri]|uniref:DUF2244 domain-containing protein n=1 Tax=Ruegeria marisrubri TaxID=1685379 RepID=A0A101CYE4_9RHOB|nr:DUF2244 domain-containing protein [Ruegeria marisrubri]KUJ85682.1 hypothetical protein AVO45_01445 [Ruegeria marisrubri]